MQFGRDEPLRGAPADTIGRVAMRLELTYLNSAVDATGAPSLEQLLVGFLSSWHEVGRATSLQMHVHALMHINLPAH